MRNQLTKLAWLSVRRRPTRSLLLFAIMAVIFTALVAQVGARNVMADVRGAIKQNVGAGFSAHGENLAQADADEIAKLAGVKQASYERQHLVDVEGAKPVTGTGGVQLDAGGESKMFLTGLSDVMLQPEFASKIYRLESTVGEIPEDGALVHKDFADQNGLQVGDKIQVVNDGKALSLTLTALFRGKNENRSGLPFEAAENQIFTNLAAANSLSADKNLSAARYLVDQPDDLENIVTEAQKINPGLQIESNGQRFSPVLESIAKVEKMLGALAIGAGAVGVAVLGLSLVFWLRGRVAEIGVMLALGRSKFKIFAQFVAELFLLSLPASLLAVLIGGALSGLLAKRIFAIANVPQLSASDVGLKVLPVAAALGVGYLIAFLILTCASAIILRQSPRAILAKMS